MGWSAAERDLQVRRVRQVLEGLLRPAEYGQRLGLAVTAAHLPGEPVPVERARHLEFGPFAVGGRWGPAWGTTWFRMTGRVPAGWAGSEVVARVSLGPGGTTGFGAEGLIWRDGVPVQGLSPNHPWLRVTGRAAGGEAVELLVEAAANPVADGGLLLPDPAGEPIGVLERAELAVRRPQLAEVALDVEVLLGLLEQLPRDEPRAHHVQRALAEFCTALDPADVAGSAGRARELLADALARPSHASAHRLVAAGHAHIDSAWLWPVRETVRKCARTLSTAIGLMDDYPDYRFICSQAAQHDWMREHYPALFARMREKVAAGQLEPVGSMWVEADCSIPSGESLVRQIVHGKRFFLDEYGIETRDVWLPDVFGYTASLPQIMKLAGIDWFVTQKISWSATNRMPHHTFWWEGIDGTRIFTHFPPSDTYNGSGSPDNLLHASRNFADHATAGMSLYPYGFGDGGGGPTREHLGRLRRARDLEGLPAVEFGGVRAFFEQATQRARDLPVWVGELYLELHRGTYTTQGRVKRGNRQCELALRDAELWSAASADWDRYPAGPLDRAWRTVLLNQFHDILPGSSIRWVAQEAEQDHRRVLDDLDTLITGATAALLDGVDTAGVRAPVAVLNPLSHPRDELVQAGDRLVPVRVPPLGYTVVDGAGPASGDADPVTLAGRVMENSLLRVSWDAAGLLTSVYDKEAGREVLPAGARGNVLELYADRPVDWDAWDIDRFALQAHRDLTALREESAVEHGPWRAAVRFIREFGASRVVQVMSLAAGSRRLEFRTEVDWHERHTLLKVAFPADVHARRATFEIQYGALERPTHSNTSWDWARFEVPAQRWADLSEPGFGVALLNDCKYGYAVHDGVLRLSLLRSPTFPDPEADQGRHEFCYALLPHPGDHRQGGVVEAAAELGSPLRTVPLAARPGHRPRTWSLLTPDAPGVVVSAVKKADRGQALVVRCYEAYGQRRRARLRFGIPIRSAAVADLLERPLHSLAVADGGVTVELAPFQILTVLAEPGPAVRES